VAARREPEAEHRSRAVFEKLKPFKELVAEDIRDGKDEEGPGE
jgi:hypothetical protein